MKAITPQGNLGGFMLLGKTPVGTCPECATAHEPDMPHNQQSLAYQYKFRGQNGRWPTWADAMAHCTPEVRESWSEILRDMGQEIGEVGPDLTKALSLRQPWAWLMIRPDLADPAERAAAQAAGLIKDIENRSWPCHYRGRVLVHSSGGMTLKYYKHAEGYAANLGITVPPMKDLQRGGIIGEFTITDCLTSSPSPWFMGPYGFTVTDAKPLPFRACPGKQRWFYPAAA